MADSLEKELNEISHAFYVAYSTPMDYAGPSPWIVETYPDYVVVAYADKYYKIAYTEADGNYTFDSFPAWVEVEEQKEWIAKKALEIKKGARNSRRDQQTLQLAHDALVDAGAMCDMPEEKAMDPDELIYAGSEIKALGNGKVAGYLVRYSDEKSTDLTNDFFNAGTDYGVTDGSTLPVYYQHGLDAVIKAKRIGRGTLKFDEIGLWFEAQLEMRDEYEKMIYELAEKGKLGWSSGAAGHLVEREQVGKAWHIKSWPIAEGSLTPTPAEPRNTVIPLKSLGVNSQVEIKQAEQEKPEAEVKPEIVETKTSGVLKMEITEDKLQELLIQAGEAGAQKAIAATEPVKTAPGTVQVVTDEADHEFKSIAEQCVAVKNFTKSQGRVMDPRLKRLAFADSGKAIQGASELVPTDGGILLEPTIGSEIVQNIHSAGPFSQDIRMLPVSSNSNSGWINGIDETSRVAGSRWGGIRGYRLAEGDALTKSKPAFRRIQWELKKYGVLVYGTDELLQDAAQFSAIVNTAAREELAFMVNDDILNGLGVSGALGVMQSGALLSQTRLDANKIQGADISGMWQQLTPTSKSKAVWYAHTECAPQLDALFAVGSTAVLFPYAGYRPDGVRTLYGRPIVETEFNQALGTVGDIVLADMSQYLGWEKGGVQYATSVHVEFLTDQEVMRFTYRFDGQSAYAAALTNYHGSGKTSPFVALSTAS